jgi:uncharacterized membrane protein
MNDPAPTTPPMINAGNIPKSGDRGWRVAFFSLLALNLAVIGLAVGIALNGGDHRGGMVRDLGFGPFTDALSSKDREALRDSFMERVPAWRDMRRTMRVETDALIAALRADPFDPEALKSAMERQQGRNQERLELGQKLILDRILTLSPQDRSAFADRLEEGMRHRPGPAMAP